MSESEKYIPKGYRPDDKELSELGFTDEELKGIQEIDRLLDSMNDENLEKIAEQKYLHSENKERYDTEFKDLIQEANHFGLQEKNLIWITWAVINNLWGKKVHDMDEFKTTNRMRAWLGPANILHNHTSIDVIKRAIFDSDDQVQIKNRLDKVSNAIKDVIYNGKNQWWGYDNIGKNK